MDGYASCKIVIGTKATKKKIPNSDITHEWMVYVKAPKNIIKNVQYKLHDTFTPNTVIKEYPFEHVEHGWGEFTIQIKILLFNDDRLLTSHFLKLHGEGDVVINETIDEIAYKGLGTEYSVTKEEEEEYQKIDKGIEYMLKLLGEYD
ncbi:YEATS domain-containing protein [Vairimorpha necatrix]|uniref:Protein AF-9 homolog n=1 Tax=Vairimorpha necatrix TaxID=6039 RepID=A0AAX4JCR5_9MICR